MGKGNTNKYKCSRYMVLGHINTLLLYTIQYHKLNVGFSKGIWRERVILDKYQKGNHKSIPLCIRRMLENV